MADGISDITTAAVTPPASATKKASTATLDKDSFLKLLVAQLQHQDPTSPQDSTQWTAQMAQFSTVEQLTNLSTSTTKAAKSAAMSQAVGLLGREVSYTANQQQFTGTVQRVDAGADAPTLMIDGVTGVSLDSITGVA
jgi:flagellar basal-body rod modification protein FlgD